MDICVGKFYVLNLCLPVAIALSHRISIFTNQTGSSLIIEIAVRIVEHVRNTLVTYQIITFLALQADSIVGV